MNTIELKGLSNGALLRGLSELLKQSRRIEADLIAHLAEVDARRIYAERAWRSMFVYCVRELHLSEAEAYLRIEVARASRRYPKLLTMLEAGDLHLSGIELLARILDKLDARAQASALARAKHKTKREIQELIAEIAPKPDVPPKIRKLPEKKPKGSKPSSSVGTELGPDPVPPAADPSTTTSSESPAQKQQPKQPFVEPLAPARYKIQFTASMELKRIIERLAALTPGADLADVIEAAVTEKLERVEAKRYGKVKNARATVAGAETSPDSREPTAAVKRAVCERDGDQCTYVTASGRRCPVRNRLEFHHVVPYAKGGSRSVNNLTLRCRTHNVYAAELDFGMEKMRRYRRNADRVGETAPGWRLGPDPVPVSLGTAVRSGPSSTGAAVACRRARSRSRRKRQRFCVSVVDRLQPMPARRQRSAVRYQSVESITRRRATPPATSRVGPSRSRPRPERADASCRRSR